MSLFFVTPAKAGVQRYQRHWIPAFAGMTALGLLLLLAMPLRADDSLARWAEGFNTPEVQREIINQIFSGEAGPVSSAKPDNTGMRYFFPKGSSWARLGMDIAYSSMTATGGPYLAVSCMMYRSPERNPMSATAYFFRDTHQRPDALSGVYSMHERVFPVNLPKLRLSFLVLTESNGSEKTGPRLWDAFVLKMDSGGGRPRPVWNSPSSYRTFVMGFSDLGGNTEELVVRTLPSPGKEVQYTAYRWNGYRFEPDSFVFENRLKALPDDVWQYRAAK